MNKATTASIVEVWADSYGDETRMRSAALQVLYLLRTYAVFSAPDSVWGTVKVLEDALKSNAWPDIAADMRAAPLMQAWSGVTQSVRSIRGPESAGCRAISDAVTCLMGAVSSGRAADLSTASDARRTAETGDATSFHHFDARGSRREASRKLGEACLLASEIGVPTEYFEPLRALKLPDWGVIPGRTWWEHQVRTQTDLERLLGFASNTVTSMGGICPVIPTNLSDDLDRAFHGGEGLDAAVERVRAFVVQAQMTGTDPRDGTSSLGTDDIETLVTYWHLVTMLVGVVGDARKADGYKEEAKRAATPEDQSRLSGMASAALILAHGAAKSICAEAELAGVGPLELAYMRSRLPLTDQRHG